MGSVILWLLDFFFQVFSRISSFILKPLFDWLVSYDLISSDYLGITQNFLNDYFYKYIRFAKEVIINVTGIPVNLFSVLGVLLGFVFVFFLASLSLRFLLNVYSFIRSAKGIGGTFKDI